MSKKAPESLANVPKNPLDVWHLRQAGNLQEALETARGIFEADPDFAPIISPLIITLLYDLGKYQEILDFYEGLSDEQREWADIIKIAKSMLALGLYERIITFYEEIPEDHDHKQALLPSLAEAHSKLGIRTEAVNLARKATQAQLEYSAGIVTALEEDASNDPNDPNVWFSLAIARENIGDIRGGIIALEKAIELNPDNASFQEVLADFRAKTPESSN